MAQSQLLKLTSLSHPAGLQGRRCVTLIVHELGASGLLEAATTWCVQHPDTALCVLAACLVFLLPLLILFGIGITAMLITFTGILVLEGTLLTVIFMIFLACIGSLAVSFAVFVLVAYFGFAQIFSFLGMERYRDSFIRFVQQNSHAGDANGAVPVDSSSSHR
ncbi:hypothetical protein KR222_009939 [Zaprionus bogoriensis]|nr:hypothetical protein KR222_009939 [Zaprionus bogoriensis]